VRTPGRGLKMLYGKASAKPKTAENKTEKR